MGNGKKLKCNECGAEWLQLSGIGFDGKESPLKNQNVCPECGSPKVETDNEYEILWD